MERREVGCKTRVEPEPAQESRVNSATSQIEERPSIAKIHDKQEESERIKSKKNRHGDSHRRVLQHIRHDEESNHASTNIHLVQLRYSSIAAGYCDILQGNIEVVLSCGWYRDKGWVQMGMKVGMNWVKVVSCVGLDR